MSYALDDECPDCEGKLLLVLGSAPTGDDPGTQSEIACSVCGWYSHDIDMVRIRAWRMANTICASVPSFGDVYLALRLVQQQAMESQ